MGCLPLAIEQAGAYVSDVQIQLGEYLPLYEKNRRKLLKRPTIGDIYNSRRQTVFTTWEVSFSKLEEQDGAAAKMLFLLAFFHHENVWEGLFDLALSDDTGSINIQSRAHFRWLTELFADKLALRSAFGRIMSFSLAKRGMSPPPGNIVLHPLVHAWGRDRLTSSEK